MKILLRLAFIGTPLLAAPLYEQCPQDTAAWERWRNDWVRLLARFEPSPAQRDFDKVLSCMERRKDFLRENSSARRCMERLVEFSQVMELSRGQAPRLLGFASRDEDYLKRYRKYLTVPPEINDRRLLEAISGGNIEAVKWQLREVNVRRAKAKKDPIEVAKFKGTFAAREGLSQFTERILLYVPGNPDVWVNFPLPNRNGKPNDSHSVALISVFTDGQGRRTSYFRNLWRDYPDWPWQRLSLRSAPQGEGLPACLMCHRSGPIRIQPSLARSDAPAVKRLNDIIERGEPAVMVDLHPGVSKLPGLGERLSRQSRSDEFFEKCAKISAKVSSPEGQRQLTQKLSAAMDCTSCHDGVTRGRLTPPLSWPLVRFQIMSGKMPPGLALTVDEKEMLQDCLAREYLSYDGLDGTLQEYLTAVSCYEDASTAPRSVPSRSRTHGATAPTR